MSGQPFKLLPDQWTKQAITEHIIIHYRWVFVMFLLPISLGYDIYMAFRSYVVFKLNSGKAVRKKSYIVYVITYLRMYKRYRIHNLPYF